MSATVSSRRNTYEHPPSGFKNPQGRTRHAHAFCFMVAVVQALMANAEAPGDVTGRCFELPGKPLHAASASRPLHAGLYKQAAASFSRLPVNLVGRPLYSNLFRPASVRPLL